MDLFITTFESVAVLLGIGLIGFWIIRKGMVPEKALGILSPIVLSIALPSLIFVNIIKNFNPSESPDWWMLPLWWIVFTAIAAVLTFFLQFVAHKKTRREFAVSLFYHNGIFFPIAILTGMFGDAADIYLVMLFLFTLFYPAFFFNTYHLFFGKKIERLNWKRIVHPVLVATVIAVLVRLVGITEQQVPRTIVSILELLGGMTIPLIMLILGGNIYLDFHKKGAVHSGEIVKFVLIKNFLFPLVFLVFLKIIQPVYTVALIILLQSAVPPVTAVPLVAERVGGDRALVNQFIVGSFSVSIVSIPLMVWLFNMVFIP
jgi:hypothetical protein